MSDRLDQVLVSRGLIASREKAKREIEAGHVYVNGVACNVTKKLVEDSDEITIQDVFPYVSRAALKLKEAVECFEINLSDAICLDIGASTGGFTQVCLENGASYVIALDVGYNQIDEELRNDKRVEVIEKYNFRYAIAEDFPRKSNFFCSDVSFISLSMIVPQIKHCITNSAIGVLLIKPQFEAGKEFLDKHGVIKDKNVHKRVIHDIINLVNNEGYGVKGLIGSPIQGKDGNHEYLLYVEYHGINESVDVDNVVNQTFKM
ncbi:MAG: TlyA family RNA methyltransferase [Erysipelotrichales bacterium]|nr:TlyA family RNA methyltransferase [Erysipelotrichales bacterium]